MILSKQCTKTAHHHCKSLSSKMFLHPMPIEMRNLRILDNLISLKIEIDDNDNKLLSRQNFGRNGHQSSDLLKGQLQF